jgi:hypothetical protein
MKAIVLLLSFKVPLMIGDCALWLFSAAYVNT